MKKIIKHLKATKKNNRGMTLVEIIVATAVFAILSSMVAYVFNSAIRQQYQTEKWNDQTDMQTAYIAENRYELDPEFESASGGATQYNLKIDFGAAGSIEATNVDLYSMKTQYAVTPSGNQRPTDENAHIKFFRVR